ncbi:hypothetical protein ACJMK2_009976 [Sinanodonta woodiana]|uniref:Uncharacterized protein n=1 Tax=Sinanodonta woodiana TaxID=1069815 RepID=A0ABD3VDZ8_SINWO
MDFAENYTCGFAEEIQSAYFDKNVVTLHPVLIKEDEVKVKHSSTCCEKKVKAVLHNVEMVHCMTDSPRHNIETARFFSIKVQHDTIFPGIKAFWLCFEAGYGKGPHDGVGGFAKRLADMAVKRHSAIIQSADDFFQWGKAQENSALKYIFVPKSQCTEAHEELSNLVGKQVKGTMQVHAVIPLGEGSIAVRNTSCFCDTCFVDGQPGPACDGWTVHQMSDTNIVQNSEAEQTTGHDESEQQATKLMECNKINTDELYQVNTCVAAIFESRWYVGQVLEYDKDDQEYNINFMIWIPSSDVLCSLDEPIKQGKTRHMFKFSGRDLEKVRNLFDRLCTS